MLFSCYTLILSSSSRNTYIFSFFLSWAFTFTLAAPFSSLQFLLCHPVYISFPSLISLTYYHSFLAFIIRMPSLKFWKSLENKKLDSRNFSFWQQAGACRECREERRKPAGNVWKRIQTANICSDSEIITYFFKIFLKPIAVKLHLLNTIVKGKT